MALAVHNTTDETIPAFAAMRIVGRSYLDRRPDGSTTQVQAILVGKPDDDDMDDVLFNGPTPIVAGGNGEGSAAPCPAAYSTENEDGADPVVGENWGTVAGEWLLYRGQTGFSIAKASITGVVEVFNRSIAGMDRSITLTSATLVNGVYAVTTNFRVNGRYMPGNRCWGVDLAESESGTLVAGQRYPANRARDGNSKAVREAGGPWIISIEDDNTGNALTDSSSWLTVVGSVAPTAWDASTTYVPGNLVTFGGFDYVCILSHTNHFPPNATYWVLVVLDGYRGYDDGTEYSKGSLVQEILPLMEFRSETNLDGEGDEETTCVCIEDPCTGSTRYFNLPASKEQFTPCEFWYCLTTPDNSSSDCVSLTADELSVFTGLGYTYTGPYATQLECEGECTGSGSGSGSGSGCGNCSDLECFTVRFPSIANGTCTDCSALFDTDIRLTRFSSTEWDSEIFSCGGTDLIVALLAIGGCAYEILVTFPHTGLVIKVYGGQFNTDCTSGLFFAPVGETTDAYGICTNWPATVTVEPCASGSGSSGSSGSGGSELDCCTRGTPTLPVLTGTVTGATGCLTSLPGTLTFNDNGSHMVWTATFTPFACTGGFGSVPDVQSMSMGCDFATSAMNILGSSAGWWVQDIDPGGTCNPIVGTWKINDGAGNSCVITVVE